MLGTGIGIEVSELSVRLFEDKLLLCRLLSSIPLYGQTDAIRNSLLTTIPVIGCIHSHMVITFHYSCIIPRDIFF